MRSMAILLFVSMFAFGSAADAKKFRVLASGSESGMHKGEIAVAGDPKGFASVWNLHAASLTPKPELPAVDFDKEMVVGIFDGDRPTGAFKVSVKDVEVTPEFVNVKVKNWYFGAKAKLEPHVTQPYEIIAMPRAQGSVRRQDVNKRR